MASAAEVERLHALFDELNRDCFGGILPRLPLSFSARMKSAAGAYRRLSTGEARRIDINGRFLLMAEGWQEIRDTLGHEMIHYWLDVQGKPCGHTPEFRRKLAEHGWSRYSTLPPPGGAYVYRCPGCARVFQVRRRFRARRSCGPCSGSSFDSRFTLAFVERTNI